MSDLRKSFHNLHDLVGKTLTGFLESDDDGRYTLLFDGDSCIEIYAWSDDDEGYINTQHPIWSEYRIDDAVNAGLVSREQADAHVARKRAEKERDKQTEIDRLQRELAELRARG